MTEQNSSPLAHPAERFDPLLRNLLEFGLVDEADGVWTLHPEVAQRLSELASTRRPGVTPMVRFNHHCDGCRTEGTTWRYAGNRYLCAQCFGEVQERDQTTAAPTPGSRRLVARYRETDAITGSASDRSPS